MFQQMCRAACATSMLLDLCLFLSPSFLPPPAFSSFTTQTFSIHSFFLVQDLCSWKPGGSQSRNLYHCYGTDSSSTAGKCASLYQRFGVVSLTVSPPSINRILRTLFSWSHFEVLMARFLFVFLALE